MKLRQIFIFIFILTTAYVHAEPKSNTRSKIKVDIVDDSVSSDHFSDQMDVRRPIRPTNNHALPPLSVQDELWTKADVSKEIKDYDFLSKDKLYFYLNELDIDALIERFPEISRDKMKKLMNLRRNE